MDIFQTHADILDDYRQYIRSFIHIKDDGIRAAVDQELNSGKLWPEPLIQFNPSYEKAGTIDDVIPRMGLHPDLQHVFKGFHLYRHQVDAIRLGQQSRDFVVTSGTGSGTSLTYLASIFHHLLSGPVSRSSKAKPASPPSPTSNGSPG